MSVFEELESEVRSYSRCFPVVFSKAKMSHIYDENNREYLDFFAGAGALNFGHNNDYIMNRIVEYIKSDGITHALDMFTTAKKEFIEKFRDLILIPGNLDYKIMFCGPTGTNSVEAALKLARKVKKRSTIFSFMGGFHGMSLGSLSLTSDRTSREGAGVPLNNTVFMPFPQGFNNTFDTIGYIENVLADDHSGIECPAAIIVETVQAEGGIFVAEIEWLKRLRTLCDKYDILLICDEIQVGCGRTGTYFSFERAGIIPDLVTVSKSIGGAGMPMSLLLLKREIDEWLPGEHSGTFRGNQLAFIGATAALEYTFEKNILEQTAEKGEFVTRYIEENILSINKKINHRGIGLIHGIDFADVEGEDICKKVAAECFNNGLIIEKAGRNDAVLKILPSLTITYEELTYGLTIIRNAVIKYCSE